MVFEQDIGCDLHFIGTLRRSFFKLFECKKAALVCRNPLRPAFDSQTSIGYVEVFYRQKLRDKFTDTASHFPEMHHSIEPAKTP